MSAAPTYSLSGLAVPACIEDLHALFDRVRTAHADLTEQDLSAFELAIVEIGGNVVKHGRPPGEVMFTFDLTVDSDRLLGRLVDTGQAVEPTDGTTDDDPFAESGRGLFLAHAVLDEFRYERVDQRNAWTMLKRRQA